MHEQIPFRTDDAILAQCLVNAGFPEWSSPTNSYDEKILSRLGFKGMSVHDAGLAAWRRKERGHVEYYFERKPELDAFIKIYRDQCAEINSEGEDTDAGTALREIMRRTAADRLKPDETPMDEREALLRVTCINLKLRVGFVNRWKENTPFIRIGAGGESSESVESGVRTVKSPGFKLVPLNASETTRRDLNL